MLAAAVESDVRVFDGLSPPVPGSGTSGISTLVRRFWSMGRIYAMVAVVLCVGLFVAALLHGQGLKSFVVLGAAAFWVVRARNDGRRARAAQRHFELRRRRLQRMRDGTWTGPYRDD
jgi:hypothetical protein